MHTHIPQLILYLWMGIFILWAVIGFAAKQTVQSRSEGPSRAAVWVVMFAWWILFAMVTVTQDHKLQRAGSYGIVRQPIYSGFMLATLGTAIAFGAVRGLVSFALVVPARGYKSRIEERLMVEQFGGEYEGYQREVKALVPLIW